MTSIKHWFHFVYYGVLLFFMGIMVFVTSFAYLRSKRPAKIDIVKMQQVRHEDLVEKQLAAKDHP